MVRPVCGGRQGSFELRWLARLFFAMLPPARPPQPCYLCLGAHPRPRTFCAPPRSLPMRPLPSRRGVVNRKSSLRPSVERLEDRTTPAGSNLIGFGADAGGLPYVRLFDPQTDSQVRAFLAYDPSFKGGVHVALGDVNGDGIPDVVTGAGAGGGPHVRLFDGRTGAVLTEFSAYAPSFAGGVNVALGDVPGDGKADIITAAGAGGGPHVRVFDLTGHVESEFFAYDPGFRGGVSVAVGDATRDRHCDILTGAG